MVHRFGLPQNQEVTTGNVVMKKKKKKKEKREDRRGKWEVGSGKRAEKVNRRQAILANRVSLILFNEHVASIVYL